MTIPDSELKIGTLEPAQDNFVTVEKMKSWNNVLKASLNWGPEKFDLNTSKKFQVSLFTADEKNPYDQLSTPNWSLNSYDAVLLINDIEKRLAKVSKLYMKECKKYDKSRESFSKSNLALVEIQRQFFPYFRIICYIEEKIYSDLFPVIRQLKEVLIEILDLIQNFNNLVNVEEQAYAHLFLEQMFGEQSDITLGGLYLCEQALNLLDKCDYFASQLTLYGDAANETSKALPPWSSSVHAKGLEAEYRKRFTVTGAIPKFDGQKDGHRQRLSKSPTVRLQQTDCDKNGEEMIT